jgi:hypothetical protein
MPITETDRAWRLANPDKVRAYKRAEYQRNKNTYRANNRLRRFGITVERYDELLDEQSHVCAICEKPEALGYKQLAVDHDHATGAIRGLLCHHCNVAIGHFFDDADLLMAAAAYLLTRNGDADAEL